MLPRAAKSSWAAGVVAGALALACSAGDAKAAGPIRIGVIAESQAIAGASIPKAVQLAADEINGKGGIDGRRVEITAYDDHASAVEAVRAFQRAVSEDHVNAVLASYVSEVVLALEPWAGRLKTVVVTPGATSDAITENIGKDYDRLKYTFHGYLTSSALAGQVCDAAKDLLVDGLKMTSAVVMSEDAAWTAPLDSAYEECLPKAGLKVLDHIRFSPDTTDFAPIFNRIEGARPDVIITGISHVGVQPTVQWRNSQVPIPMFGVSGQATAATFWADTNGAAEGVSVGAVSGPDVPSTGKTLPFVEAYAARYGAPPSFAGYTAYDAVYYLADAIRRAGSDNADKLVEALERTDYEGTIGRIRFGGRDSPHPHGLQTGEGAIRGLLLQWQDGRQVNVWPRGLAQGELKFPKFVEVGQSR